MRHLLFTKPLDPDAGESRADLIVENKIVVEVKSIENILPIHLSQVLTHLRYTDLRFGLLLNLNSVYLKHGITRILNGFESNL